MPFDSVILFLGINPKDIIQKYVNALNKKLLITVVFIVGKTKNVGTMCLSYNRGMSQKLYVH